MTLSANHITSYDLILKIGMDFCLKVLGLSRRSAQKWSVESVHSKNIVSILHLLVALARLFRAPVRLPENVAVSVIIVQVSCVCIILSSTAGIFIVFDFKINIYIFLEKGRYANTQDCD